MGKLIEFYVPKRHEPKPKPAKTWWSVIYPQLGKLIEFPKTN